MNDREKSPAFLRGLLLQSHLPSINSSIFLANKPGKTHPVRYEFINQANPLAHHAALQALAQAATLRRTAVSLWQQSAFKPA